ncbi:MAG: DNA polymerase III subunit delta [Rhodocyclaceae bacterium]|nr:DNA polymerase III subunit delta [Rhodocyclaceae bacterium]MCA3034322.1 DNA polymerase III subunit delta [Rhodocyclaceae bacterium]MCA3084036.1 DNA polymerase III subunit delta [Rhodocyclaceae bacterium]
MRLTAEQFLDRPPKSLQPLYVVYGADPLGALEASDSLRELAKQLGYVEREVFTAESGFDWSRLASAGSALSLFATQRLIELRIPTGKPGKEGSVGIENYCKRLPDDTVTLVSLPDMDWQGKQTRWFVALEAAATVIEAQPVDRENLPRWLADRLKRVNLSASSEALDFLADRVEGNLLAAKQEIEKLALLCPPGEVSLGVMENSLANVSRYSIATLMAAIHAGDAARIAKMLDGLKAEGEPPPLILWMLAGELRLLLRILGVTKAGRQPFPSKAREVEKLARKHTAGSLVRLNLQAARIDRMIKGVNPNDVWDALLQFSCGLAGARLPIQMPQN